VHRKEMRARLIRTLGWFGATVFAAAPAVERSSQSGVNGSGTNGQGKHAAR